MAKIRVYELARELNLKNKALLEKLQEMEITVASHMSSLDDETVARIKANLTGKKATSDVITTRVRPTVIRRRRKKVAEPEPEPEIETEPEPEPESEPAVEAEVETIQPEAAVPEKQAEPEAIEPPEASPVPDREPEEETPQPEPAPLETAAEADVIPSQPEE